MELAERRFLKTVQWTTVRRLAGPCNRRPGITASRQHTPPTDQGSGGDRGTGRGTFTRMTRRHRRITTGRNKEQDEPTTAAAATTITTTTTTAIPWPPHPHAWHGSNGMPAGAQTASPLPVSRRLAALPVSHRHQTAGPHVSPIGSTMGTPGGLLRAAASWCVLPRCGRRASAPGTGRGREERPGIQGSPPIFILDRGPGGGAGLVVEPPAWQRPASHLQQIGRLRFGAGLDHPALSRASQPAAKQPARSPQPAAHSQQPAASSGQRQ